MAANAWESELEEKSKSRPPLFSKIISPFSGPTQDELERLGMKDKPNAPDYDYLGCFKEQWEEDRERERQAVTLSFLKETSCPFYFPFEKMGEKTLEACNNLQKYQQDRCRFLITSGLVVVSIVVTLIVGLITLL